MQDLSAKVVQVIDENRMLVGVESAKAGDGRYSTLVMVKCKTTGITDGKFYGIDWEGMTGSPSLKVTGTTTYKTRSGSKTVFVLEPEDKANTPAKAEVVTAIPLIGGVWAEAKQLRVVIVQKGNAFTAKCVHRHPEHGEIRWTMTGSVAKDGSFKGTLIHTKAPKDWSGQLRKGTLSADGNTIKGNAVFRGGSHDFVWTKTAPASAFVGRWRIGKGKGADASYFTLSASGEARRSDKSKARAKWELVGNEARIDWSCDWKDAICIEQGVRLKVAFGQGVGWNDPLPTRNRLRKSL